MPTPQELLQKQLKFLNSSEYHKKGFTGKKITILNTEELYDHGVMTSGVIKEFAPDATVINGTITTKTTAGNLEYCHLTVNDKVYDLAEAIDFYGIKIITTSLSGKVPKVVLSYLKNLQKTKGIIQFNSAGNDDSSGVNGKYSPEDTAISVGAAVLKENGTTALAPYSSIGDEVDFIMFTGTGQGTSAASPALAAMTALLLQRYGNFNQAECVEILKSISIDLGQPGKDQKHGWGLPVLPLTDKLEILERLRGGNMDFKDVEKERWSKPAIDRCVAEGLLVGFEDGTFRPTEHVTREQFAQILVRVIDKIK